MLKIKMIIRRFKFLNFAYHLILDFNHKEGVQRANSLAYNVLISFVPFFVSTASLASFVLPMNQYKKLESLVLSKTMPGTGVEIAKHMQEFYEYSGKLSIISFIFLFITSILMVQSLRHHLTKLWEEQNTQASFISYFFDFGIIVIGPGLLGLGMLLTTYLASFSEKLSFIFNLIPVVLSILAFTFIYKFIPANKISFNQSLITGAIAGIAFEIAKKIFTIYVEYFATDGILYGALATIPLLIAWFYISCLILLFCGNINAFLKSNNYLFKIKV